MNETVGIPWNFSVNVLFYRSGEKGRRMGNRYLRGIEDNFGRVLQYNMVNKMTHSWHPPLNVVIVGFLVLARLASSPLLSLCTAALSLSVPSAPCPHVCSVPQNQRHAPFQGIGY